MPNRMLYTGLLTSKKINQLNCEQFELYIRLLLVVDDFGRYLGSTTRISRACWPDRENMTSKKVIPLLLTLQKVGLLEIYTVNNEKYIEISNWTQRTRQIESKYPPKNVTVKSPTNDSQMTDMCQSSAHVDVDVDVDVDDRRNSTEQTSCSAPVVKLPLNDKSFFEIRQEQVNKWSLLYPSVDVISELRKMIGWLEGNPKNKKTKSGIGKFVNGWLARQQDKPKIQGQYSEKPKQNFEGVRYDEEFLKTLEVDPDDLLKKLQAEEVKR